MARAGRPFNIGLISDTHDLLRPEARDALAGVDHILHAGDICGEQVLAELARIAPVTAVRGNNDRGAWASALKHTEFVQLGGAALYVVHDIADLDIDPPAAGVRAVIHGHSHKPYVEERDGVVFVNPGSAGPRRFKLPVSIGFLEIANGAVAARLLTLEP
jgi:uncharacterized protein